MLKSYIKLFVPKKSQHGKNEIYKYPKNLKKNLQFSFYEVLTLNMLINCVT